MSDTSKLALAWISTERNHTNAESTQMTHLTQAFGKEYYQKRCADASNSWGHLAKISIEIGQIAHCSGEEPARNRVIGTPYRITKAPEWWAKKNLKRPLAFELRLGNIRSVEIQAR